MSLPIITFRLGDITQVKAECIVNASNETGLGCHTPNHPCIDNAIHRVAGPRLLKECQTLNGIPEGTAAITNGYNLPAQFIIHATGPKKDFNGHEDHQILGKTYLNILELAERHKISEVVFCLISSGMYGFDKEGAVITQLRSVMSWLKKHPNTYLKKIVFNAFTKEEYDLYMKIYPKFQV